MSKLGCGQGAVGAHILSKWCGAIAGKWLAFIFRAKRMAFEINGEK
jgi:hypothetical protein